MHNNTSGGEESGDLKNWLALHHAPGVGPAKLNVLMQQSIQPFDLLGPGQQTLFDHLHLNTKTRAYLRQPDWHAIDKDLKWAQQTNCFIIPVTSTHYPTQLRQIADPPTLIFVQGDPELLHYPQLAMVGSRNPTHQGQETAAEFAKHLSLAGLIITSGMALGIDTASHQGALSGSGLTIAVAGTGLDYIYPSKNKELAENIASEGALVSEYITGTRPLKHHFPQRNRIISGLSTGTLVVEAAMQSGSLITARQAMEQGREVFAIPGSIHNPLARGCHTLIRQGAKLVETGNDVLHELAPIISRHFKHPTHITPIENNKNNALSSVADTQSPDTLPPQQRNLLDYIEFEPVSIDTLVERSRLTSETISSMLVALELSGHIQSSCGGLYSKL
ncbi:MAG: DNA-protecting protein DprA [Gammaproteobacteria bacterium]|nr:DNA-protecting protein DprA [Gammaproteobacteria bacterium]